MCIRDRASNIGKIADGVIVGSAIVKIIEEHGENAAEPLKAVSYTHLDVYKRQLVYLGRNDIGKISEIGAVNVDKYLSIERFSHVMHIGSTVTGTLRKDLDSLADIDSILPAGTLSGACLLYTSNGVGCYINRF